jgi:hypothetical protein
MGLFGGVRCLALVPAEALSDGPVDCAQNCGELPRFVNWHQEGWHAGWLRLQRLQVPPCNQGLHVGHSTCLYLYSE